MAKHVKAVRRSAQDREKLKQVALLWRAQSIYQRAHEVCQKKGAYKGGPGDADARAHYRAVINVLDDAMVRLKAIGVDASRPRREPLNAERLTHQLEEDEPLGNCASDEDCPEDYICDGRTCVYLFAD
jgi:hypothetical protein